MKIIDLLKHQLPLVLLTDTLLAKEIGSLIKRIIIISEIDLSTQEIVRSFYNEKTDSTKMNVLDYLGLIYAQSKKFLEDKTLPVEQRTKSHLAVKDVMNRIAEAFEEIFVFGKYPYVK